MFHLNESAGIPKNAGAMPQNLALKQNLAVKQNLLVLFSQISPDLLYFGIGQFKSVCQIRFK